MLSTESYKDPGTLWLCSLYFYTIIEHLNVHVSYVSNLSTVSKLQVVWYSLKNKKLPTHLFLLPAFPFRAMGKTSL